MYERCWSQGEVSVAFPGNPCVQHTFSLMVGKGKGPTSKSYAYLCVCVCECVYRCIYAGSGVRGYNIISLHAW